MAKKIERKPTRKPIVPKVCAFCKEGKEPSLTDIAMLERYITERGKILARQRTGVCAMHQRHLTTAIKHARHLALLPFLVRV